MSLDGSVARCAALVWLLAGCALAHEESDVDRWNAPGSARWGLRYNLAADRDAVTPSLDLSYLASPDQPDAGAAWEARDWSVYVRPDPDQDVLYNDIGDQIRAPLTLTWDVGGGATRTRHEVPISALGGAAHIAATNVGLFLSTTGAALAGLSPRSAFTGALWVAPGAPRRTWRALTAVQFQGEPATARIEFPVLSTGRFRLQARATSLDVFYALPANLSLAGAFIEGANTLALQSAGVLTTYHLIPGAVGIVVDGDIGDTVAVEVEVFE